MRIAVVLRRWAIFCNVIVSSSYNQRISTVFPVSTAKKAGVAVRICEALQMICSASLALYVTLHLLALHRLTQ
jgi:hypothetical protein